jgi:hypothetical protein
LAIVQFAAGADGAAPVEPPASARRHVVARIPKMSEFPIELFAVP